MLLNELRRKQTVGAKTCAGTHVRTYVRKYKYVHTNALTCSFQFSGRESVPSIAVVLFVMLYKNVLAFESVGEIPCKV